MAFHAKVAIMARGSGSASKAGGYGTSGAVMTSAFAEGVCFQFYQWVFENMVSWPSAMDELRKGFCQNSYRGLQ